MTPSPADVHAEIASGATDAATWLSRHPDFPPVCSLVIEHDHTHQAPRAYMQLAACAISPLRGLATVADLLDEPTVTVRRFVDTSHSFTSVAVHAHVGTTAVGVWSHPDEPELAELFTAVGHTPEPGIATTVTAAALHTAAGNTSESEPATREADTDIPGAEEGAA